MHPTARMPGKYAQLAAGFLPSCCYRLVH